MLVCERLQGPDYVLDVVADRQVTPDQVWIQVGKLRAPALEVAAVEQVEEHGATAKKRLDVARELLGIVGAELGEQLSFAAGPLQQGADGGGGVHRHAPPYRILDRQE